MLAGIGKAWVKGFIAEGHTVFATDISAEGLAKLSPHPKLHTLVVDVSDAAQVKNMVGTAEKQMGRLDVMFNNAGVSYSKLIVNSEDGEWEVGGSHTMYN